jgi:hypothetical protein
VEKCNFDHFTLLLLDIAGIGSAPRYLSDPVWDDFVSGDDATVYDNGAQQPLSGNIVVHTKTK